MKSTLMKSMAALSLGSMLFLTGCASNAPAPSADSAAPAASASTTATTSATASPTATEMAPQLKVDPEITKNMSPAELENYKKEIDRLNAMTPEERDAMFAAQNDPHAERLVAPQQVKAGMPLHVSGGTYAPGTTITVYAAEPMAAPTMNAEGNWEQVGDEVIITEKMTATADAKGNFDVDLMIPATVAPHMVNVMGNSSDGRGDLVMTTVVK